ncbi:hypothetical protein JCM12825_16840 [Desulfurobacterium crinifex]
MKVVALSVHFKSGKRVVVGAVVGKGYSNEPKLEVQVLQWISLEEAFRRIVEGKTLLADKGYDSEDFICQVLSAGFKPYVKIRNQGIVRSEFRKVAQQLVDSDGLYKQRGRIEALFGEEKQALCIYERTKSFHIAMLFVLAKFVLFNLCAVFIVVIFQTLSSLSGKFLSKFLPSTQNLPEDKLLYLSCCKNENNMLWGFFKCFEKSIKSFFDKHMEFINDIDLFLPLIVNRLSELPYLVNFLVCCSINFYNIEERAF